MSFPQKKQGIPRNIQRSKSLSFSGFDGYTQLISESPPVHGKNRADSASYGASQAGAGIPAAAIHPGGLS